MLQLFDDSLQVRQLNSGQVQGYLSIFQLRRADLNRLAFPLLKRIYLLIKGKVILLDFLFNLDRLLALLIKLLQNVVAEGDQRLRFYL